jgi:YfiH family protein
VKKIEHDDLSFYQFDLWPDLTHGIFTRNGGMSSKPWSSLNVGGNVGDDPKAVRRNHELVYAALGLSERRACTVWQVHSADVVMVTGPVLGRRWLALADGMITDRPDTPLAMRYADCTPLLFRDRTKGVIGIAHAGWRGTVQGVARQMVEAMTQAYGCKPSDIQAGIGPSIGPERYQVGDDVVDSVHAYFGTTEGLIRYHPSDHTAYFDLWAANRLDLERAGVEQIEVAGLCTAQRTDEFFSHRAENGRTGRFGAVLSL